jgi:pimeloyl-ACP methyl ester carboxylesterase
MPEEVGTVETLGTGPRVVLVHGSVTNARWSWTKQHALADSFTLVMPNRSGYPPHPPLEHIDFERQADDLAPLLEDGTHLVGFSYGGIVSLLAAERRSSSLKSLAVIEPPAVGLCRGRGVAAVDELAVGLFRLFWSPPEDDRAFLEAFMELIGGKLALPRVVPPDIVQGVRALRAERPPWDAEFALDELRAAPFPKLVISGGHNPALEAICDVLAEELGAERTVVASDGHNIPQTGAGFNETLASFLRRSEAA